MEIKKYPQNKRVKLKDIGKGNCFMTIYSDEDRQCPYGHGWASCEIFLCCESEGSSTQSLITVVHLDSGTIDTFNEDVIVERVKAHIICE